MADSMFVFNIAIVNHALFSEQELHFKVERKSGAGGIRTPYLLTASQTFSQLNYGPIKTILI